jgi:hypothetical protein
MKFYGRTVGAKKKAFTPTVGYPGFIDFGDCRIPDLAQPARIV